MTLSRAVELVENDPGLQVYFPEALAGDSLCPLSSGEQHCYIIPHVGMLIVPEADEDLFPVRLDDPDRVENHDEPVSSVVNTEPSR